jgi:hypothetical protein
VSERYGAPAIKRLPNRFGATEAKLALTFHSPKAKPVQGMPQVDDGLSPCSWTAWLAEFDRQHLAMRVSDTADFELIERRELH